MTVKQLIEKLEALPKEKSVLCQVCAADGSVWNMYFDISDVPNSSSLVVLTATHPDLKTLSASK